MTSKSTPATALSLLALVALAACRPAPPPPPDDAPRLVLFIVVDQVRADYLDRFRPLLTGGLGRLLEESVVFNDAHHFHSATVTATGHATLATGMLPRHHGIVGNSWFDRELDQYVLSVTDLKYGRSPHYLLTPTLGDRLKAAFPPAKVAGIGGKDRSAILSAGRQANAAYWYDREDGTFTTSKYYGSETPAWLDEFHERRYLDRYFGETWSPLLPIEELEPYDVETVDWGLLDRQLPHPLGGPSAYPDDNFYSAIYASPFVDEYVVELAKALIEGEGLGTDAYPDLLAVTLSAVDSAGHSFGPNSPELVDTLLRVDRSIAGLLAFVDDRIGLDSVSVVLSSDHGVAPIPEYARLHGEPAADRFDDEEIGCFQRLGTVLRNDFGDEEWLRASPLYFDRALLEESGVDRAALVATIRETLEACPGVERIYDGEALESATDLDAIAQLFRNNYNHERSGDLLVQIAPHTLTSFGVAASHGSPYPYDTHVPWLLRLPSAIHEVVEERVHTIDVAPTLSQIIGLEGESGFDGVDRSQLFHDRPAVAASSGNAE